MTLRSDAPHAQATPAPGHAADLAPARPRPMPARQPRVMMTTDTVGGVWTFSLDLARGLAARGSEVLLAVEGPPPDPAQRRAAERIQGVAVTATGIELEWRCRRGALQPAPIGPAEAGRLTALAERFSADIVHVNGYRDAALAWPVPVVATAHSCVRSWWLACRGEEPPAEWDEYGRGVRRGLAAADAVVAPTRAFARDLGRLYGPLPTLRVIRNGRDLVIPPAAARLPIVLAAGRMWDEAKNLAALEAAAKHLPWPLVVAGAPPERATAHVHPTGPLANDALLSLMSHAAIFAAPVRYEPFGLATLEAATAGCALVLGDIPSQRELWRDGAVFVDPDDVEALVRAVRTLAADPDRRETLRRRAQLRARKLSATAMTGAYLELYADLLHARADPTARVMPS